MFREKTFKQIVINQIIGWLLFFASVFTLLSQISYSVDDPGIGKSQTSYEIANYMGFIGAYYSSALFVLLGLSSYILTLFLGIQSLRFITKGQGNFLVRFFFLIIGLIFLNLCLNLNSLDYSLIGNITEKLFLRHLEIYFFNSIIYLIFVAALWLLSIIIIFLSMGLNNKFSIKIFRFIKIIIFPILKIHYLLLPLKNLLISQTKKGYTTKRTKRVEPTILKRSSQKIGEKFNDAYLKNKSENLNSRYVLPSNNFLKKTLHKKESNKEIEKRNQNQSKRLEEVLREYGVEGKVVSFKSGPVVTLFEYAPAAGIKTSKIIGLSEDIARTMSSVSTRIASQPGKTTVGIEIPNHYRENVFLGDLISSQEFLENSKGLTLALGKNIAGEMKFTDLEKMPHLLIAGTTGSGKSVGINSMIVSLLYRFPPSECKLILIDPKMLELRIYEDIPHLLTPVVTDPNKAVFALKWVVREMENRYRLMSSINVKNIDSFNTKILNSLSNGKKLFREVQTGIDKETRKPIIEKKEIPLDKMPLIVVVIDEMADLMMVAGKEVENLVQRLAQMARASGIHLIAATQRPSVDVITGTIKANFPSRISFRVASRFDSRTILNEMGAEQLLGSGDMLFLENGSNITRLHGGFISENEIEYIVNHIKKQSNSELKKDISFEEEKVLDFNNSLGFESKNVDELYETAVNLIIEQQKVSTSFVQRYLQIGYNRAARIIEKMEEDGIISEQTNAGKRTVLKKNN